MLATIPVSAAIVKDDVAEPCAQMCSCGNGTLQKRTVWNSYYVELRTLSEDPTEM